MIMAWLLNMRIGVRKRFFPWHPKEQSRQVPFREGWQDVVSSLEPWTGRPTSSFWPKELWLKVDLVLLWHYYFSVFLGYLLLAMEGGGSPRGLEKYLFWLDCVFICTHFGWDLVDRTEQCLRNQMWWNAFSSLSVHHGRSKIHSFID